MTVTPVISPHALERCIEMGISTKVPKHILRDARIVRPDKPGSQRRVAVSATHPEYAVVFDPGDPPTVITVLFNAPDFQGRDGVTYVKAQ